MPPDNAAVATNAASFGDALPPLAIIAWLKAFSALIKKKCSGKCSIFRKYALEKRSIFRNIAPEKRYVSRKNALEKRSIIPEIRSGKTVHLSGKTLRKNGTLFPEKRSGKTLRHMLLQNWYLSSNITSSLISS